MDMRFGTWNVRSLYTVGFLMTVSRELFEYKRDLVEVQQVRSKSGGADPAGDNIFFKETIMGIMTKMCLHETYSKVRIGKYLSDISPIQNGLKQGDVLSPLLFNFALEYAIRKVQ
jgi:hypothetical protein